MTTIFPAGFKECIALAERDFSLIDFNDSFERFPIRIDHRSPQLLRQQPRGLAGDAELVHQLTRRHTVGMGCHEMRCPKPCRQRQFGAMHRRSRRDRGLPAAIETFMQTRPAFQPNRAALATAMTYKTMRPALLK